MTGAELGVVVVTWNCAESLAPCLEALRSSAARVGARLELVVVDNGSNDASAAVAGGLGVDVLVENPFNAGFGVAASQGISRTRAEWVLLLNPDVAVEGRFVAASLEAARLAAPEVSTLVPDLRFASAPDVVNSRGIAVDETGVPLKLEAGMAAQPVTGARQVFGGSTGCVLYRREALEAVGGLETAFFAYLEDVDLAWRLNRAGWIAVLVPEAVAFHEVSASTGQGSKVKSYLVARSRRLLFALDGPHTARARASRLVAEAGHAVVATAEGAGSAPWRGRLAAVRARRYVRFVRRSRAADPRHGQPPVLPRLGLLETRRRKRRITTRAVATRR